MKTGSNFRVLSVWPGSDHQPSSEMWNFVVVSLVVCCFQLNIETAWSAVAWGKAEFSKTNSSMCLEPGTTGPSYMIGSFWSPRNMCARAMCNIRGDQLYVSYATCGLSWSPPNCVTTSEPTLPYPDCCPRSVCPEDKGMESTALENSHSNDGSQSTGSYNQDQGQVIIRPWAEHWQWV